MLVSTVIYNAGNLGNAGNAGKLLSTVMLVYMLVQHRGICWIPVGHKHKSGH